MTNEDREAVRNFRKGSKERESEMRKLLEEKEPPYGISPEPQHGYIGSVSKNKTKKMTIKTKAPNREITAITVVPVEIDPKLPEVRRTEILGKFIPIYEQIQELSDEYAAITQADVTVFTQKHAKRASDLRKKLVTLRGKHGLKGVHGELKEDVKVEGQVIDLLERKPRELLLEWESKLEEIEKFQEREEARRIAELHESRYETLKDYILDENAPELAVLGEMEEWKWEETFEKFRNIWNAEQEKIRLANLRAERLNTAKTYELYIDEFSEIAWEALTEKQFKTIVSDAKAAHEKHLKEAELERKRAEEIRLKAEKEAQEARERAERYRRRVSLVKGAEQREDGLYYNGKKIATVKSLEESSDENFQKFLDGHLEKYNADVAAEEARKEAELKAERERIETQARIDAEIAAQKAAEEKTRREETEKEEALRRRREQEEAERVAALGAPDSEKLRELANAFAALEVPDFRTEKGISIQVKFLDMRGKWIAGMLKVADEMEGLTDEDF